MKLTLEQEKLKISLHETIEEWFGKVDASSMDTYLSDNLSSLMTEAAFSVLSAQADLTAYCRRNNDGSVA